MQMTETVCVCVAEREREIERASGEKETWINCLSQQTHSNTNNYV